jgi:hypothetical protein
MKKLLLVLMAVFMIAFVGGGSYQIIARNSGMCVEVASGSYDDGANVIQSNCINSANYQLFQMVAQ